MTLSKSIPENHINSRVVCANNSGENQSLFWKVKSGTQSPKFECYFPLILKQCFAAVEEGKKEVKGN